MCYARRVATTLQCLVNLIMKFARNEIRYKIEISSN